MFDKSFILRYEVLIGIFLEMYTVSLSLSLSCAGLLPQQRCYDRNNPNWCCCSAFLSSSPAAPGKSVNIQCDMLEGKVPWISCRWTLICLLSAGILGCSLSVFRVLEVIQMCHLKPSWLIAYKAQRRAPSVFLFCSSVKQQEARGVGSADVEGLAS